MRKRIMFKNLRELTRFAIQSLTQYKKQDKLVPMSQTRKSSHNKFIN